MNHTAESPVESLDFCDIAHKSFFVSIAHLGLIKVEGVDAKKFLQGQLTCHLEEVTPTSFRLGAHCNVQGRALATFYIVYFQDAYFLVLDRSIITDWLNTLKKYSVFFKVGLSEVSDQFNFFGWQGVKYPMLTPYRLQVEGDDCMLLGLRSDVSAVSANAETRARVLAVVPKSSAQMAVYQKELDIYTHSVAYFKDDWKLSDIMSGMAHLNADTIGQYIPIELNYDVLEGIHFKKGCYTGQEIIARMHFRGKPKFRVVYVELLGLSEIQANQSLYIYEEENKVLLGKVFSWVKEKETTHALLLINMAWLKKQDRQKSQLIALAEPLGFVRICSDMQDVE